MTDTKSTSSKSSSGLSHRNDSSKKSLEVNKMSEGARAKSRSTNSTPIRPSTALNTSQSGSVPRLRPRPVILRSQSSPLSRTLSVCVSNKEKRWSMRLEDPKSPVSTTYQDDFQSPEALSLNSLNLETSAAPSKPAADPNAPTTYRESYQWRPQRRMFSASSRMSRPADTTQGPGSVPGSAGNNPHRGRGKLSVVSENKDVKLTDHTNTSSSLAGKMATHSKVYQQGSCNGDSNPTLVQSDTSAHRTVSVKDSGNIALSLSLARRKSTPSPSEDTVPVKQASDKKLSSRPDSSKKGKDSLTFWHANGSYSSTTARRDVLQSAKADPSPSAVSGTTRHSAVNREAECRTPQRSRAYQLQSSNGGSPFTYGSDSGYWV